MEKRYVVLVVSLLLAFVADAQRTSFIYKGVNFKCKLENNAAVITEFDVDADSVVIPSKVEYKRRSYPVKAVNTHREGCNYVARALVLEEGIEKIGNSAFKEFRRLRSVYLPSTIKNIGRLAFRTNKNMAFYLPQNIKDSRMWDWDNAYVFVVKSNAGNLDGESSDGVSEQNPSVAYESGRIAKKSPSLVPVDNDIPMTGIENTHTYCVIIANENYEEAPNVDYAKNDGRVFAEYCQLTLGIPVNQIRLYTNAGYNDVQKAIRFMETAQEIDNEAKLIFYYSGHGIPNETDRTAYILPVDGSPKDVQTCFSLKKLYARLGKIKARNVTVLLDACFSGSNKSNGDAIFASRSIVRAKQEVASGNMVVISAASGDETALPLKEAQHGLFTYYLLKKLRSSKGRVTLGELYADLRQEVMKSSILDNDKKQTPTVTCAPAMDGKWKNIYF